MFVTQETQNELTIQNLREINKELTTKLGKFMPEFEISYDQKTIDITMKLGGKTTYATVEIEVNDPEHLVKDLSDQLLFPFQIMVGNEIVESIRTIVGNVEKRGR